MSSSKDFNIAAPGTDKQKAQFESEHLDQRIRSIQTPEFRRSLQDVKFRSDVLVKDTEKRLESERDRMAQYIIDRDVAPHPEMNLRPDGARAAPDWERRQAIRTSVEDRFTPRHEREVEEKRKELYSALHAEVDRTLNDERELRRGATSTGNDRAVSEAKTKLAHMKENARDITKRLDQSNGLGRGRSR